MYELENEHPRQWGERIKGAMSWIDTLWSVLGFFGWKTLVVSAALGAAGFAYGYVRHEPVITLGMSAITFVIAVAFAAKLPVVARLTSSRPNFRIWQHLEVVALWQASCLFAEINPPTTMSGWLPTPDADAYFSLFVDAVRNGELERVDTRNGAGGNGDDMIGFGTFVTRASLQRFAAKRGYNPRFLLPPKVVGRISDVDRHPSPAVAVSDRET